VGLLRKLAEQMRKPSGVLAPLAGLMFRLNLEGIDWTIDLLDIQPSDCVLEVGFGPGDAIQKVTTIVSQGSVTGVDFSQAMLRKARKRNAGAYSAGRIQLIIADACDLPCAENSFDKAFVINVIYFWSDPVVPLKELHRVLKPGGSVALYMVAKQDLKKFPPAKTSVYSLYTGEEVVKLLTEAGFRRARFEAKGEKLRTGVCVLAER